MKKFYAFVLVIFLSSFTSVSFAGCTQQICQIGVTASTSTYEVNTNTVSD